MHAAGQRQEFEEEEGMDGWLEGVDRQRQKAVPSGLSRALLKVQHS
jgi:hypothetical protein